MYILSRMYTCVLTCETNSSNSHVHGYVSCSLTVILIYATGTARHQYLDAYTRYHARMVLMRRTLIRALRRYRYLSSRGSVARDLMLARILENLEGIYCIILLAKYARVQTSMLQIIIYLGLSSLHFCKPTFQTDECFRDSSNGCASSSVEYMICILLVHSGADSWIEMRSND